VQAELVDAAQNLFIAKGFEQTTIDDIAKAVGMSRRSFFRYFSSKDDLVLGTYEQWADRLAQAMVQRPLDEPVWESLRRVFDHVVDLPTDDASRDRVVAMDRIVLSTTTLKAAYLQKLDRAQGRVVGVIGKRARLRGTPIDEHDLATVAIVGAAFACLQAAHLTTLAGDDPAAYGRALDTTMAAVTSGQFTSQG
jgi:AcrR family transcriptional regulator